MRYQYLDILRWLCILLMISFHLNYSLVNIFENQVLNFSETFWYLLGKLSALGFMMISGVSYYLASKKYSPQQLQRKYFRYSGVLTIIALGITLLTYFFIPSQLILFGILHLFAVSFFLLPFVTRTKFFLGLLGVIIVYATFFWEKDVTVWYLFPLWFYNSDFKSADYYPLIPYFWYIIWWYLIALYWEKYGVIRRLHLKRRLLLPEKILAYIGKKSLILYLIHQPIIIIFIWVYMR